jgi:hypothetical protein
MELERGWIIRTFAGGGGGGKEFSEANDAEDGKASGMGELDNLAWFSYVASPKLICDSLGGS